MKKILYVLLGVVLALVVVNLVTQGSKLKQSNAIVRVINARKAAYERCSHPIKNNSNNTRLNLTEYTAALKTIDTTDCPQKFIIAWNEYIDVIASKRTVLGILEGSSNDAPIADSHLREVASDYGVTFKK